MNILSCGRWRWISPMRTGKFNGATSLFDAAAYQALYPATRHRVLAGVVRWFNASWYRPRRAEVDQWHARILAGKPAPLAGVLAHLKGDQLRFYREASAVAEKVDILPGTFTQWDRWGVKAPAGVDRFSVAALGQELARASEWQVFGAPRATLETSPALWHKGELVSLLNISPPDGWTVSTEAWWARIP